MLKENIGCETLVVFYGKSNTKIQFLWPELVLFVSNPPSSYFFLHAFPNLLVPPFLFLCVHHITVAGVFPVTFLCIVIYSAIIKYYLFLPLCHTLSKILSSPFIHMILEATTTSLSSPSEQHLNLAVYGCVKY